MADAADLLNTLLAPEDFKDAFEADLTEATDFAWEDFEPDDLTEALDADLTDALLDFLDGAGALDAFLALVFLMVFVTPYSIFYALVKFPLSTLA